MGTLIAPTMVVAYVLGFFVGLLLASLLTPRHKWRRVSLALLIATNSALAVLLVAMMKDAL